MFYISARMLALILLLLFDFQFESFYIVKSFSLLPFFKSYSEKNSLDDEDLETDKQSKYENLEVKFINTNKVYKNEIAAYEELKRKKIDKVNEEYRQ